jgi:ABC-type transport system substrate-binding protein
MGLKEGHVFWICVVVAMAVLLPTISPSLIAKENDSGSSSAWIWTKEYPKPSWWRWDESYWPTKPARGGYLHEARSKYIGYMNPNHWPCNDYASIGYMYEFLVATGGDLRPRVPWLAESWEYLDPLTVIMHLKTGIRFHDGSEFNAESLKYHIEWILDKKNNAFSKAWLDPIKSIEAVNEHTIRWCFRKPWAGFIPMMAYAPGYIMSAEALKGAVALREAKRLALKAKNPRRKAHKAEKKAKMASAKGGQKAKKAAVKAEKALKGAVRAEEKARIAAAKAKGGKPLDTHPVGSGRFVFEEASKGNYLKLKRNPNWWFGKSIGHPDMPYFDGIKVIIIPDPSIQLANLRAAKIDRMSLNKSQYMMIKDDPKFNIYVYSQPDTAAFLFNSASGPCKDIRLRKAISHAIDRKALIHGTQFGMARIASCIYPEEHWCHNPELKPVRYDPELAKKYLAEAGYRKGLSLKCISVNDTEFRTRTEAIKAMLSNVGIELKVESLDPVAVTDKMVNLEFDLLAWDFKYIDEPDTVVTTAYHPSLNSERNNNKRVISLIEAGREEVNFEKRAKIYQELERIVYDDFLDVWLWWEVVPLAFRSCVHGWNNEMWKKGEVSYKNSHPLWFKDGKR